MSVQLKPNFISSGHSFIRPFQPVDQVVLYGASILKMANEDSKSLVNKEFLTGVVEGMLYIMFYLIYT